MTVEVPLKACPVVVEDSERSANQIPVSVAMAKDAKDRGISVVLDGGSWKPGLEELIAYVDYAICGARFRPPECDDVSAAMSWLEEAGVSYRGFTRGDDPIVYESSIGAGVIQVSPPLTVVDTMGAGDFLHGAFCYYIAAEHISFPTALEKAAGLASFTCGFFGTRSWMTEWKKP